MHLVRNFSLHRDRKIYVSEKEEVVYSVNSADKTI